MDGFPDCAFWDFSRQTYDKSGVSTACLGLQNRLGIDVNVLLFCCFAAAEGHPPLGERAIGRAIKSIASWNLEIVQQLRAVRTSLKNPYEDAPKAVVAALRDRTLTLELECEHVEQLILAAQLPEEPNSSVVPSEQPGVAAANVIAYLGVLKAEPGRQDVDDLGGVIQACFEDFDPEVLASLVKVPTE